MNAPLTRLRVFARRHQVRWWVRRHDDMKIVSSYEALVDAETGTTRKTPPAEPTGPSHQTIEPDTGSTTSLSTGTDGGGHG